MVSATDERLGMCVSEGDTFVCVCAYMCVCREKLVSRLTGPGRHIDSNPEDQVAILEFETSINVDQRVTPRW